MRTLKFKPRPTVTVFAAVNHISGGFRSLPTATGKARRFSNTNMVRKYGSSLRRRVVFLHVNHYLSPREIIRLLKVGKTFVHKVLKLYSETKGVDYLDVLSCCGLLLSGFHVFCQKLRSKRIVFHTGRVISLVRSLIDQYPELHLDELRDWIYFRTGEIYAIPTLSRWLNKIALSVKTVSNQLSRFLSVLYGQMQGKNAWFGKIFVSLLFSLLELLFLTLQLSLTF